MIKRLLFTAFLPLFFFNNVSLASENDTSLISAIEANDFKAIYAYFDCLDTMTNVDEIHTFVRQFVTDVEAKYIIRSNVGLALDYLQSVVEVFPLPSSFFDAIDMIVSDFKDSIQLIDNKSESLKQALPIVLCKNEISREEISIPDGIAVGFCEALGGALLCIIPIPSVRAVGVGMVVDGARRMVDGTHDQSRQNHPSMPKP